MPTVNHVAKGLPPKAGNFFPGRRLPARENFYSLCVLCVSVVKSCNFWDQLLVLFYGHISFAQCRFYHGEHFIIGEMADGRSTGGAGNGTGATPLAKCFLNLRYLDSFTDFH